MAGQVLQEVLLAVRDGRERDLERDDVEARVLREARARCPRTCSEKPVATRRRCGGASLCHALQTISPMPAMVIMSLITPW
jgi:hypothetical protein